MGLNVSGPHSPLNISSPVDGPILKGYWRDSWMTGYLWFPGCRSVSSFTANPMMYLATSSSTVTEAATPKHYRLSSLQCGTAPGET